MAEGRTAERDDTRSTIVLATARILRERGAAAVTTRAVAAAAGVQAPTIYRLFGDKDGLLEAVAEHVMATYVGRKSLLVQQEEKEGQRERGEPGAGEVGETHDPVAALREGWRVHVEFGLANPDLAVLLSVPGRLPGSRAVDVGVQVLRRRVHRLAEAGRLRVDEGRAVDLVHAAGTGAVLALLASPPGERDPGLADALLEAVLAAVLTDAPALPASDALSVAVAFTTVLPGLPALTPAERSLLGEWVDRSVMALRDR